MPKVKCPHCGKFHMYKIPGWSKGGKNSKRAMTTDQAHAALALRRVRPVLSEDQKAEILEALLAGHKKEDVAAALGVSDRTVYRIAEMLKKNK